MAGESQSPRPWCKGRVKQRLHALCSISLRASLLDLIRQITCYACCSALNAFELVCPQGKWKGPSGRITVDTNDSACFISGPCRKEIFLANADLMLNSIEYQRVFKCWLDIEIYRLKLTTFSQCLFPLYWHQRFKRNQQKHVFITLCLVFNYQIMMPI